jgi:hypothetical protein
MGFYFEPFKIISAAKIPGIQPKTVKINTIKIEPQPLSTTAKGGQIIANNTRKHPMIIFVLQR